MRAVKSPDRRGRLRLVLLLACLFAAAFVACKGKGGEKEQKKAAPAQSQVKTLPDGSVAVTLDRQAQAAIGLLVQELPGVSRRQEWRAFGTVLDVADLADLHRRVADARAQAEKARASRQASGKEYERLKVLYADDRNVSARAVEAAQAAAKSDEAASQAAEAALAALEATARGQWGPVVGDWIANGSAGLDRLLNRQDVLVNATLSPDTSLPAPPSTAFLEKGAGSRVPARFVSAAARTDPRIQGVSLFYVAPAGGDLLPGVSVTVFLPAGATVTGTRVPRSAVVWTEGSAWIYVQTDAATFARRPIATDFPDGEGYFVGDFPPRARVVVRGAQTLLSEESRSQLRTGEEGGEKD